MKSTGIVRKIDELGRIVIPIELRRALGIEIKDAVEVFVDQEHIILKKYKTEKMCQISGEESENNLSLANGKIVLDPEVAKHLVKEIQKQLNV